MDDSRTNTIPANIHLNLLITNFLIPFGTFFFLFGLLFVFLFGLPRIIQYLPLTFGINTDKTIGTITSYNITNASENHRNIYEIRYTYKVNGITYENTAYETSYYPELANTAWNRPTLKVSYLLQNPKIAAPEGFRSSTFSPVVALVILIFPGMGLLFLYFGFKEYSKTIRILKNARRATGKALSVTRSNVEYNHQPLMNVTMEVTNEYGEKNEALIQTLVPQNVTDDPNEQIIYNALNPKEILAVDTLPKAVKAWIEEMLKR